MEIRSFTASILAASLLLAYCSLCSGQICGNGQVEFQEECDDNNTMSDDGCNGTCVVEDHYECTHTNTTPSVCTAIILIDLNIDDNTTLDRSMEYFEINSPVFLIDINTLDYFVRSNNIWIYFDILILVGDPEIEAEVGLDYSNNPAPPIPLTTMIVPDTHYPNGINGRNVSEGERVFVDMFSSLTEDELNTTLEAVIYKANEHPGYLPRDVCLVAKDTDYTTTACVSLYFIGTNSNPPSIVYIMGDDVAVFVEGQSQPVMIVTGSITVTDDDHPTRFLIESATAQITGFTTDSDEWLSLNITSFTLLEGISHYFDRNTGALTISGNATTEVYTLILQQLTYFNNMSQPLELSRSIEITVFDGVFHSLSPAIIEVTINNTNDNPFVSLDGETPVITEKTINYTEGTGEVPIVPTISVIDVDPEPMIMSATVTLTNPIDGSKEIINITDTMGLHLTASWHSLVLSGANSPTVYTAALRTLTYTHLSANPGNPSIQDRFLEFTVKDVYNASSETSILTLTIIPVNDAPILSFTNSNNQEMYSYTEDDPPINIGGNILLIDVDSSIMSVSLSLTNLLDGVKDDIGYNSSLVGTSSITDNIDDSGLSRIIVFTGSATDATYAEILRSLTYSNLHTNDSVTDGQRAIVISATDTSNSTTVNTLTLLINVTERNDGPAINLGDGNDAGFTITYIENEPSVGIGLSHLIEVMDEEDHSISSMDIELVSTNGPLDDGDLLLLRTPVALPFIFDPNTTITTTMISINLPGESTNYTAALQAVRYINTEDEPTLYFNGTKLNREIIIRITDVTTDPATNEVRVIVEIEPINDNRPRITINSDPMCTYDYRTSDMMIGTINRRSVSSTGIRGSQRKRRRSIIYNRNTGNVAAPQVLQIVPTFIHTNNQSCLSRIIVTFNTDTNAPVVEVQQELDSLLTFAPSSVAKTPHHGYWSDYKTLVIVFRECVVWEVGDEQSRKLLYVVFYGNDGSCDWGSPCDNGVCYYNSTGCPVTGYHSVYTSTTNINETTLNDEIEDTTYMTLSHHLVLMLICILFVALLFVCVFQYKRSRGRRETKQFGPEKEISVKTRPVTSSHIIDIHVPAVTSSHVTKSPLQQQAEKTNIGATEKGPLDDHFPSTYTQSQDTDITTLTTTSIVQKTKNLPRKRPSHPPTPGTHRFIQDKKAKMTTDMDPKRDNVIAREDGHDMHGLLGDEVERIEEGEVEEGERDILRGLKYYSPTLEEGSDHAKKSGTQEHWQTTESIARVKGCHYSSTQSREHSKHTHSDQKCNNSRQHTH